MERNKFQSLLKEFSSSDVMEEKITILYKSDFPNLTEGQIDKLLSSLKSQTEIRKFNAGFDAFIKNMEGKKEK